MLLLPPRLQVRFVVMSNIFTSDLQIHAKFDIKGSTGAPPATSHQPPAHSTQHTAHSAQHTAHSEQHTANSA
jgi:hypothetical protein